MGPTRASEGAQTTQLTYRTGRGVGLRGDEGTHRGGGRVLSLNDAYPLLPD